MKYFIDTEFLEGTQKKWIGKTKPTIDLISIGIVAEDDREYYAVSNEFNLKEAWNRYDKKINKDYKPTFGGGSDGHYNPHYIKEYWLRDNVLRPIFDEHYGQVFGVEKPPFTYEAMKVIINEVGLTHEEIAYQVFRFVHDPVIKKWDDRISFVEEIVESAYSEQSTEKPHQFYGYYADYDWVVFCWLFGNMMKLPKGFPMYCIDLKQMLDVKCEELTKKMLERNPNNTPVTPKTLKMDRRYPRETNAHNALADAHFNSELYEFITEL